MSKQKNDDRDAEGHEASRRRQARQPISSQAADPRRASGVAPCRRARHAARPMGQSTAAARPSQGRHCGVRQQARQDRLGGAAARRKVRRQGTSCWSGQSRSALTDRCGLREAISRSPDSRTPLRKPGLKNGVIRRREVYEHPSAPLSILAGRSPPKPDTLQQTDHRRSRIISRRRGGP
jgi:hypothetical protein